LFLKGEEGFGEAMGTFLALALHKRVMPTSGIEDGISEMKILKECF
jgi:hypothetical protein